MARLWLWLLKKKRFRWFRFRFWFLEKRFRRFRLPVPVWFLCPTLDSLQCHTWGFPRPQTQARIPIPGHLKPVILKPVGQMSVLGQFDLPGVVPGCFLGRPFCASKTRVAGSWLGIARTEARNPSDRKMAQDRTCG